MESPMKVLILAGGFGTRIRSLFPDCPKPLIPFNGKPFLQWQIELLATQGFRQFVLCIGYLSEQIIEHFGDGSALGVEIKYAIETEPLGTGGALKNAAPYINQGIMLLNGDTYLNTDFQELIARHTVLVKEYSAIGSLSLVSREDTARYGRVIVGDNHQITGFQEKSPELGAGLVNAGAYIFEPRILDFIPASTKVSLEQDILPTVIAKTSGLFGLPIQGSFIDMGTPKGYNQLLSELAHSPFAL